MAHEDTLTDLLSDFARTLLTDFPIDGVLDHLVRRIVDVLPVTSAGVTLITDGAAPRFVAASDAAALKFERLQSELDQGPCLLAFTSGELVSSPDLEADDRFPAFTPAAVADGLAAAFAFPLRHGHEQLGALDLYRDTRGVLDPHDLEVAQTLADVTAAYLLNARSRDAVLAAVAQLDHDALHDPLTRLPNRALLQQRLALAAGPAGSRPRATAVLFADLDGFKQVNDTHGHHVGDELLLAVARRLSGLIRTGDTLARVSGDEFVFLCEQVEDTLAVNALLRRITGAFAAPFTVGGLQLTISASVGVAVAEPGSLVSDALLAEADLAMHQAKRAGGGSHRVFDLHQATRARDLAGLEEDLRTSVAEHALHVVYQPVVRTSDGALTGVEALLRWTHPVRGAVPVTQVVEIAEQSSLINEIGAWVLEHSCQTHGRWRYHHPGVHLDLAVNVSARQLLEPRFVSVVEGILDRTGMPPESLVLEMTENMLIEDSAHAMTVLADLRRLGIRLALDDFGTGFSSLSYLRRLPVDIVKIDRGFVAELDSSPTGGAIVAAVTSLAHVLGFSVTAEGVETAHHRDQIRAMGCDSSQGYYYSRPVSAGDLEQLILDGGPGDVLLPAPAGRHRVA